MTRGPGHYTARLVAVLAVAVLLALLVHLGIDAARHRSPWSSRDTAFILAIAEEMFDGARLYVDWHENNPPSIFLMAQPAVAAGRALGISSVPPFNAMVAMLAAVGTVVLVQGLRAMRTPPLAVVSTVTAYLLFVVHPGQFAIDFGERDHVFALLLIPEAFALAGQYRSRWRPAWCFALAFTAMMKPHFVLVLAVVQILALRRMRPTPASGAAFVLGALAPLALLWMHSPESLRGLLDTALGIHLDGSYAALNHGPQVMLRRGPLIILGTALAAAAALAWLRRRTPETVWLQRVAWLLLAWGVAIILQQGKYFAYHYIPLWGVASVLLAWVIGESLAGRRWAPAAAAAALALLAAGNLKTHLEIAANGEQLPVRLGNVVPDARRVLTVSVNSHGMCTPYEGAPHCVGPRAFDLRLFGVGGDPTQQQRAQEGLQALHEAMRRRPELIAFNVVETMPDGRRPAAEILQSGLLFGPGEYLPLSAAAADIVQPRGWRIFRRADIAETTAQAQR